MNIEKIMWSDTVTKNLWIIVMGHPGSGKTTFSEILHERGFISFEYSAYFRHILNLQNEQRYEILKKVREYKQSIGRVSYTLDLILWVEKNIPDAYDKPIFLIGARDSEDIKILKSFKPVIFCIYLCSSKENRMRRIIQRNKVIDKKVINEIETKNNIKINPEIITCIKEHTNYLIENNGEIKDLINHVDNFLNHLEKLCQD